MHRIKTASGQAVRKHGLLINGDFALLWSGQAISKLGDVVFDYTLVFWIATSIAREQRWAPLAVSGIFVATALPTLVAGPIAGVFVDRWPKRPTMLLMDALRAILIVLLLLVTGMPPPPFQLPPLWAARCDLSCGVPRHDLCPVLRPIAPRARRGHSI